MKNTYVSQTSETDKGLPSAKKQKNDLSRRRFLARLRRIGTGVVAASTIGSIVGLAYPSKVEAKANNLNYSGYPDVGSIAGNFSYDGEAAAVYADNWALSYYHNIDFSNAGTLEFEGDDCTNFVSNCLFAGGMPMTQEWYSQWSDGIWWEHTNSWTSVSDLYNYLIPSGLATVQTIIHPYEPIGNTTGLVPGDLIFVDWGDGKGMSHLVIQTNPQSGSDRIDSHTTDRKGLDWQLLPYNPQNSTTTFYLVHIISNTASD